MQVTCPVCQLKGHYDAEPGATYARVICARCSSEYEVVLGDGQYVTALQAAAAPVVVEAAPMFARPHTPAPPEESVLDDVFSAVPEETDFFAAQSPVLEDVFAPASVASAQKVEPLSASVEPAAEESRAASADEVVIDAEENVSAPVEVAATAQTAGFDGYVAGARVMRASPLWILACGLVFVGCIVLFNRITGEATGEVEAASAQSVVRNDSTNQSAPSSFAPDVEIESQPADTSAPARETAAKETAQVVEPAAAQESVETPKESAAPAEPETPAVAQTVREEVAAAPASSGRFTVQVGAHNASDKAAAQAAQLKSAGFEARVVAAEVPNRGTWYRVQAGRFETREAATRHGAEMRAKGAAQTVVVAEIR